MVFDKIFILVIEVSTICRHISSQTDGQRLLKHGSVSSANLTESKTINNQLTVEICKKSCKIIKFIKA